MALLTTATRKRYFKELGLGEYNKANILKLQKKYMLRKTDWDGLYGKDTDTLLRHVYNVTKYSKNFAPQEFVCECGGKYCSGYPDSIKRIQVEHLQAIRSYYGRPMTITSGLRCKGYNSAIGGSISNSLHLKGYATDFYMRGVTDTLANRKSAVQTIRRLKRHHYTYGNGINSIGGSVYAPYMGNALHTDTQ